MSAHLWRVDSQITLLDGQAEILEKYLFIYNKLFLSRQVKFEVTYRDEQVGVNS